MNNRKKKTYQTKTNNSSRSNLNAKTKMKRYRPKNISNNVELEKKVLTHPFTTCNSTSET